MPTVYLIPSFLAEQAIETILPYIPACVKDSAVIFAENERTARRFLKAVDPSIVIDDYEWHTIHKAETEQLNIFKTALKAGKNISIISEAGCPGVADPGQVLVQAAQELNCTVKPLVGPSAILLALMASGMNGQQFEFLGYLPIDNTERIRKIKELETSSARNRSTKIFIETPYRNNQLLESLVQHCQPGTSICVATDITGKEESIVTKKVADWKKQKPELHKKTVTFLLYAGN